MKTVCRNRQGHCNHQTRGRWFFASRQVFGKQGAETGGVADAIGAAQFGGFAGRSGVKPLRCGYPRGETRPVSTIKRGGHGLFVGIGQL